MALPLEDYAVVGDRRTAAVIGRDASVDWLCLPRFDGGAVFTGLLGGDQRWTLSVPSGAVPAGRRYLPGTMVLCTELACAAGILRVADCMPLDEGPQLVRELSSSGGAIDVESRVRLSFATGERLPMWRRLGHGLEAVAGPDAVVLDGDCQHERDERGAIVRFRVTPERPVRLRLAWRGWDRPPVLRRDAVTRTAGEWRTWLARSSYSGSYRDAVERSLLVLRSLTDARTGGILAAATSSLPEQLGGSRNWDYRYCWLRDATFTLLALLESGYADEAAAWREWLVRAVAGDPSRVQIVYGPGGEASLEERTVALPGYGGARPVRVGNDAVHQAQHDVYGEVLDALCQARDRGLPSEPEAWDVQRGLVDVLESQWREPDHGIWEVRGEPQHFVHSKVMAWVGLDRMVRSAQGELADVQRWSALRDEIHAEVCDQGFDERRGTFVQSYGSRQLDAAVLRIPAVGFLPPRDPRVLGTLDAVQRELSEGGLLRRYESGRDGLPGTDSCFLPCSFWLADALALAGRPRQAREVYERLLDLRNDVGLLTEEYDVDRGRLVGNLPQALSHVPVVNTAHALAGHGAARTRSRR